MNTLVYTRSKVEEASQNFIDEMRKVLQAMYANKVERVEFVS